MKPIWWGYLDDKNIIHVKRYTTDRAIANAEAMPFVKGIFDPFTARDYNDARRKIMNKYYEVEFAG